MSLELNRKAPDFSALDYQGKEFKISDHFGKANIFLVFNRGFV
jgi:peroxiredoxin